MRNFLSRTDEIVDGGRMYFDEAGFQVGSVDSMNLQERNQLQQDTWTVGDFPKMGVELSIVGELLCESVPVLAGDRVLDVGTASGNTALAAARRRATVTGVDITP